MMTWQVLQLPETQSVMLRVPTMGCGYADPRELRQQSEDLRLGSNMRRAPTNFLMLRSVHVSVLTCIHSFSFHPIPACF